MKSKKTKSTTEKSKTNTIEKSNSNSNNNLISSNNTDSDATPDVLGNNAPIGGASSPTPNTEPSVSKKAYEIEEAMKNKTEFIPSIAFLILAMIFLIVGYKRRNSSLE